VVAILWRPSWILPSYIEDEKTERLKKKIVKFGQKLAEKSPFLVWAPLWIVLGGHFVAAILENIARQIGRLSGNEL